MELTLKLNIESQDIIDKMTKLSENVFVHGDNVINIMEESFTIHSVFVSEDNNEHFTTLLGCDLHINSKGE